MKKKTKSTQAPKNGLRDLSVKKGTSVKGGGGFGHGGTLSVIKTKA